MADVQVDRRQLAAERRRRILGQSKARLERIHGRPTDPTTLEDTPIMDADVLETPVVQPTPPADGRVTYTAPPVAEKAVPSAQSKQTSRMALLERTAAVMHATQRLQLLIACLVAFSQLLFISDWNAPLTLLFYSELGLILAGWMYFQLTPDAQMQQVQSMRQERRFNRGAGIDRVISLLRILPGIIPVLNSLDDVRLCFRIAYADLAVFVIAAAILRCLDPLSVPEL